MDNEDYSPSDYCACFIDLLGQRNLLRGEGRLPNLEKKEDKQKFQEVVRHSVMAIKSLQKDAEFFLEGLSGSSVVLSKQQRWSDGLVYYSSLNPAGSRSPLDAVFEIFSLAGYLCFMGLAQARPVRGAIEAAWGLELHENELYGAVVAKSYELESEIAQCPRIVVGEQAMLFINEHVDDPLAQICINMTSIDIDGSHILDYLGNTFTKYFTSGNSAYFYERAWSYIADQYALHKANKDRKLAMRYSWLINYFEKNREIHIKN